MKKRIRHTRRRITRTGLVFVVCAMLSLLASWNSGINLYYLIFAGIASFIAASFVLSRRTLQKLEFVREAPRAVNRNESFGVLVRIANHRKYLPVASIRIENEGYRDVSIGYVLSIPAMRTAQIRYTELFERRGLRKLPSLELVTSFPFGIIEARRIVPIDTEVLVYPRVLAARTALIEQLRGSGELPKVAQGPGDEFFSLREYIPGDDLRFISWRASARTGTLYVKELEQQTSRYVVIAFDSRIKASVDNYPDRFEEAIELVASIAVTLLNRQYRVAIVTPTLVLREGEGAAHALKVLELLARIEPAEADARDPFDRALEEGDYQHASYLLVSPDPAQWGAMFAAGQPRVLDPREVIHA
ncbi:MAG: DUF58 domain-containing protein [Candidatus Hydrogenedentes bacterium]|nr:DUF58 domain-containing protein [Candidatus Hydrogenedentota bacterium]